MQNQIFTDFECFNVRVPRQSDSGARFVVRIRFTVKQLIRTISGCMCKQIYPELGNNVPVRNLNDSAIIFVVFLMNFPPRMLPKRIAQNL